MLFSIGSDPEVFLKDKEGNSRTAIGLLGGTKEYPVRTKHGWIQEDGCAAEFNSIPAHSLNEFIENHRLVIKDLEDILKPLDLSIDITPSVVFNEEDLCCDQALITGCDPDVNAWTLKENPQVDLWDTSLRVAGGHIHVAFDCDTIEDRVDFVKALDIELGLPSVLLDDDTRRRELYGKAGSFRPKFKEKDGFDGVEYRTLSNFWLKSEGLLTFVYKKVEETVKTYKLMKDSFVFSEDIQNAINNSNKEESLKLCKLLGVRYGLC